jgi:Bacterial protein of unknown function (DUF885)
MGAASPRMTALDRFFDSYYRLRPVNATFTGVHVHDHRLPDWSPEGLESAATEMRALRTDLESARPRGSPSHALSHVTSRDHELALSFLDVQLAEDATSHFQRGNPSLAIGEAAFGVISLMTRPFAPVSVRARAAASRLSATAAFLDGVRRSIAGGVPDVWRAKCLRECDGVARLLDTGVSRWIVVESIARREAEALTDASRAAAAALDDFRRCLERDVPAAPADRLAAGPDLFDMLLARGHWCDRPRAELAAEARTALDEALARLVERAKPDGWPAVQARLADDHPTVDDYLTTYQRLWDECRQRAEEADLVTWPDYPIRYVPIPAHTRDAAPSLYYLFYRSPAPFDPLRVHDYVVTPIDADMTPDEQRRRLRAANASVIKLNHVVHHGGIGHHVQNFFAYHGESAIGRVAAVDCASRIGMFLGGTMAEGWACYATDLMDEHGFLTRDESLAQQHTRARLLARAVVDIGLAERSLTFDSAVALYRDRIGLSHDAAVGETCKNSMYPGTAVMYWLGTDAIHQLRRRCAREEGAAFSLRRFHDRLLAFGSIPVPLVARMWS